MLFINSAIKIEGGHLACLIFLPDKLIGSDPSDSEMQQSYVDSPVIETRINDGEYQKDGRQTGGQSPMKAMVIACHGFRGGKENGGRVNSLANKLTARGFGLLAFDFRGTGESSGSFAEMTITSQADDLQQVLSFVDYNYKVPMIVLGRSLGGSTVLAAISNDNRPVATVLWSTPLSVKETFTTILGDAAQRLAAGEKVTLKDDYSSYELGPGFWQDLSRHDFEHHVLVANKKPLLLIHGENDEIVGVANALSIKVLAPGAQLVTVPGADHKFIEGWELREDFTVAWLNHLFPNREVT